LKGTSTKSSGWQLFVVAVVEKAVAVEALYE
jgi:hypothetical protein